MHIFFFHHLKLFSEAFHIKSSNGVAYFARGKSRVLQKIIKKSFSTKHNQIILYEQLSNLGVGWPDMHAFENLFESYVPKMDFFIKEIDESILIVCVDCNYMVEAIFDEQ